MSGGTFVSRIATSANAEIDVRIARVAAVPGVSWRRIKGWEANWSGLDVPFVRAFADVVGEVTGRPVESTVRLPASDASR